MRSLISICLAIAMVVGAATASAQSLIVIALCEGAGDSEPTFSGLQTSEAVQTFCTDVTPENQALCLGIADLSAGAGTGLACATAISNVFTFGFEKTFIDAVVARRPNLPPVFDTAAAVPSARSRHVFQNNQTDLAFIMERPGGDVDLIGCHVPGAGGPGATYVQPSDGSDVGTDDLSCADALQDSLDSGAMLSGDRATVIAHIVPRGVRAQQGRVALDSDANEAKPAEFVIVRVGQLTMDSE